MGSHSFLQGIFPRQGLNPGLPHCRRILYCLSHQGRPRMLEWVAYPFSGRSSGFRTQTAVSCIAGDSSPAELPGKSRRTVWQFFLHLLDPEKISWGVCSKKGFPGSLASKSDSGTMRAGPWISGSFFCPHDPEFQRKDRAGNFFCVELERPLLSMKRMTVKRTEALRGCRAPFSGRCFSGLDFCSTLQGRYVSRSELGRGKGG